MLITVIIPTHNRADLVVRAIAAVLEQQADSFEIIVVDDGSTDDTKAVVTGFGDSRIRYHRLEKQGATAARNVGVAIGRGNYLIFLDSDDQPLPRWLECYADAINTAQAEVICCGCVKRTEGVEGESQQLPKNMGKVFDSQTGLFLAGTFCVSRRVFEAAGGYDATLPAGHHTDLAMRIVPVLKSKEWQISNIFEPLIVIHAHRGEKIRSNHQAVFDGTAQILRTRKELLLRDPRTYANYCAVAGVSAIRLRRYNDARRYFLDAARIRPLRLKHWLQLAMATCPPLARRVW